MFYDISAFLSCDISAFLQTTGSLHHSAMAEQTKSWEHRRAHPKNIQMVNREDGGKQMGIQMRAKKWRIRHLHV